MKEFFLFLELLQDPLRHMAMYIYVPLAMYPTTGPNLGHPAVGAGLLE